MTPPPPLPSKDAAFLRPWKKEDYNSYFLMTAIALGAIALMTLGLFAKAGALKLRWKALVGSGLAFPLMGYMAYHFKITCCQNYVDTPQIPDIAFQEPLGTREAQAPHQLYLVRKGQADIATSDSKKRVPVIILPKVVDDPFYDRLKPGDQILCSMNGMTYRVSKYDDEEVPYDNILLLDEEIDGFTNILDGEEIHDIKELAKRLDPNYTPQDASCCA